jgi:hypothetical protein
MFFIRLTVAVEWPCREAPTAQIRLIGARLGHPVPKFAPRGRKVGCSDMWIEGRRPVWIDATPVVELSAEVTAEDPSVGIDATAGVEGLRRLEQLREEGGGAFRGS